VPTRNPANDLKNEETRESLWAGLQRKDSQPPKEDQMAQIRNIAMDKYDSLSDGKYK
jgi:hypothetical protein